MNRKLFSCFLFFSVIYSGEFNDVNIDNISSTRTLSIAQDSTGFIWIGTDDGLNRYDGFQNKVYRSDVFDETTISGNRIWKIHVDKSNTTWVLTDKGVCYYDAPRDQFERIDMGSRPQHIQDKNNTLYVSTLNSGVYAINKETKSFKNYLFDPLDPFSISSSKFSHQQTKPTAIDGDNVWIGTMNGLNRINQNTGQAKRLYSNKTSFVKSDTITATLFVDDVLYVGTSQGLSLYTGNNSEPAQLGAFESRRILNLFLIKETNAVGVVSKNKLGIFEKHAVLKTIKTNTPLSLVHSLGSGQYLLNSPENKNAVFLSVDIDTDEIYQTNKVELPIKTTDILVDNEGGAWLVGESGVVRTSNIETPSVFTSVPHLKEASFDQFEQKIYVLSQNKIMRHTPGADPEQTNVIRKKTTPNNQGLYIWKDTHKYVYNKELYEIVGETPPALLAVFNVPINGIAANDVSMFLSLKNSGLAHYDRIKKELTDYRKNRLLSRKLPTGASSLLLDGETLWLGSEESGLYEVDVSNASNPRLIKHHTTVKSNKKSFSSNSVSCIIKQENKLFIGTNGDGLFIYENNGNFDKRTISDGLPSNNIISIAGATDTSTWFLTNSGLVLYNWRENSTKLVGRNEGLPLFIHKQKALVSQPSGNVAVVAPGGYYFVRLDDVYENEHESTVLIESVFLIDKNNNSVIVPANDVRSTHKTPTIRFNLTAPSLYKAGETTFSYFIDGYHDDWVENGQKRYVEIQGLNQGAYTLFVKAHNNEGYESKNTAQINFQIIPPPWETVWAYMLYFATTGFGIFGYVKRQRRLQAHAMEEQHREEELEEARQFQLDMLPKTTPDMLNLDISATIQTASEVGGDYYDFFPQGNGESLYVVVGDATGHGMTAGMMVSITKAGLYGIPPSIAPNDIAKRLNRVIKNIDLGWNRMAINVARFWEDRVEFTSAAMPPAYHYHKDTGNVDEILLEGLPLGSLKGETFSLVDFEFKQGDSLVFISDGLPEATNQTEHMLGYQAVQDCVQANGHQNANDQKQALLDLGSVWLGDLRNQDDITIVVVKKTN
jgi:serine phosphatase RsbU (regulator of sigma subunit)/ligand-binding sensor domain-containing protein